MNDYFKILDKINKRKIDSIYFLQGNDIFMKQEFVKTLFNQIKDSERKIFHSSQGDAEDIDFLDNLMSFGLFSTKKVIVYYGIEKFSVKYRKKLLKYTENPDKHTILVLIAEKTTAKFVKSLMTAATTVKVWTPFPNQYVAFVAQQINRMGIEITGEGVNLLASITNDSLHHTFAEFEKVLINAGTDKKITASEVKKVVGGEKKYNIYDFLDAIGNKNFYKSIEICEALAQMGTGTPFMIISMFNFFNDMYVCMVEEANKLFSYNWKKKQQINKALPNYRKANFGKIFHHLAETDLKSKSTGLSNQDLVVPLIYEIFNA